jgi:hypothetical protein
MRIANRTAMRAAAAVGFCTDAYGNNHGYEYRIADGSFTRVTEPGHPGASLTAAAINNRRDVANGQPTLNFRPLLCANL